MVTIKPPPFLPRHWWMHAFSPEYRNILLCGKIDRFSMDLLSELPIGVYLHRDGKVFCAGDGQPAADDTRFDSIIVNRLEAEPAIDDSELARLYERQLDKNGKICLLETSDSLQNLARRPLRVLKNLLTDHRRSKLGAMLRNAELKHYPSISFAGKILESLTGSCYSTNKNTFKFKEKLRVRLFNSRFARIITNANLWVISKPQGGPDFLDRVLSAISKAPDITWHGDRPGIVKIYYKPGKFIMSVTSEPDCAPEYIAVIAFDIASMEQRLNEKQTIEYLRGFPGLSQYLGEFYSIVEFEGFSVFVMTEQKGVTVDEDNDRLELMVSRAAEVVFRMARETLVHGKGDFLRERVSAYSEEFRLRYPDYSQDFEPALERLEGLDCADMPALFLHGDMKLENFILDQASNITGIIDFELAELEGFPMLDLLYLLVYNRQIQNGGLFHHAYAAICEARLDPWEQRIIDDYLSEFGLDDRQFDVLLLLFILHHYSVRYRLHRTEAAKKEFSSVMESIETVLARIEAGQS